MPFLEPIIGAVLSVVRPSRKAAKPPRGKFLGRARTHDGDTITYRMLAGSPGTVTRTHPMSIFPALIDANAPPTAYGQAVLVDPTTQGVRPVGGGDAGIDSIYGITVRSFPTQQATASNFGAASFGGEAPPASGVVDVLTSGSILTKVSGGGTPVKGGRVFIWYGASAGSHVQGGFETTTGASTVELDEKSSWNGGVDSSGVAEVCFNL